MSEILLNKRVTHFIGREIQKNLQAVHAAKHSGFKNSIEPEKQMERRTQLE
jgi:hypothetical protein